MISNESGEYLVKIAKDAIKTYLESGVKIPVPADCPEDIKQNLGVFVTLNKKSNLRGCIGYVEPVESGIKATIDVAISAAVNDPRFKPVTLNELDELDLEVTVLTEPELILVPYPELYADEFEIGKHGLMIKKGYAKGLLLPQVAIEQGFNEELFLEHTCMKAGISSDSWMDESCDVYKFEGQIFK